MTLPFRPRPLKLRGGGAGASIPEDLQEFNKEKAREIAGDRFVEADFDKAAQDGVVKREAFLEAAAKLAGPKGTLGEQIVDPALREGILLAFKEFDINGDGTISRAEFVSLLTRDNAEGKSEISEKMADEEFDKLDKDGSGTLGYDEFAQKFAKVKRKPPTKGDLGKKRSVPKVTSEGSPPAPPSEPLAPPEVKPVDKAGRAASKIQKCFTASAHEP